MTIQPPKLNHLKALNSVVYYGSINAAAKALWIPQPTLSRAIKELEENLNVSLVVRGRQGITLTDAGISFAEHSASIISQLETAANEARASSGRDRSKLNLGISPISVNSIMAGALDRILRDFKLCSVSVEDNPLEISVSRVRNGILDFAIGNADADVSLSDFTVEHLMDCPFVIVCKRGHPLENSTRLEQLRNANWWVTGEFNVCQRKYPLFNDMSLRQSLHTRSHIVGLPMVFNYSFLALLSSVQVKKYKEFLSVVPIKDLNVIGHYSLIYRRNVPLSRIAARMIEYLHLEADNYPWHDFS